MAIVIEVNQIPDADIQQAVETVIRGYLGERPAGETWNVWIRAASTHYEVMVRGPNQTRARLFFDDARALPEKVREWLEIYPFR